MKLYYDTEANELVTETQLRDEFAQLQHEDPATYGNLTFAQYENNCYCGNGGTLEEYLEEQK